MQDKISKFVNRLSEFLGLTVDQIKHVFANIDTAFTLYALSDGQDIVANETLEKLKKIADPENKNLNELKLFIQSYIKEMSVKEEGKDIIEKRLTQVLTELIDPVKDRLTPSQKEELLNILK